MVTHSKSVADNSQKGRRKLKTSITHTRHFRSEINNSLQISRHFNFDLVVHCYGENTVVNLPQCCQALVHSQSISQCSGSRISNSIPFKTVKESTCTPELVQLVNGIVRHSVYNSLQFFQLLVMFQCSGHGYGSSGSQIIVTEAAAQCNQT